MTRLALATMTPRPIPGKTYTLLHCDVSGNGLPVATIARPSVQTRASSGVHSAQAFGLLNGNTMGRGPSMVRTMASVNVPR